MIQELNEFGLVESIIDEEFLNYFYQLPRQPPRSHDDTYFYQLPRQPPRPHDDTQLTDDDQIQDLLIRHALYRIKY